VASWRKRRPIIEKERGKGDIEGANGKVQEKLRTGIRGERAFVEGSRPRFRIFGGGRGGEDKKQKERTVKKRDGRKRFLHQDG